jgi:hypothetical protein
MTAKPKTAETIRATKAVFLTALFLKTIPAIKIPNPKIVPMIGKWLTSMCK